MPLLKKCPGPLNVLEVDDPKLCMLMHLMTALEPIDPVLESPLDCPVVQQRTAVMDLLSEVGCANIASEGMLLCNLEKNGAEMSGRLITTRYWHEMRVKRAAYGAAPWYAMAGGTGDPTSGIVRYGSHMRKSGGNPSRIRNRFAFVEGEPSSRCAALKVMEEQLVGCIKSVIHNALHHRIPFLPQLGNSSETKVPSPPTVVPTVVLQRDSALPNWKRLYCITVNRARQRVREQLPEFPFISYYVINKNQADPVQFHEQVRVEALRRFNPRLTRHTVDHTLELFDEVATIARPPFDPRTKRPQSPATGYIISVYKVFDGDDREKFEKNWLYWTAMRQTSSQHFDLRWRRLTDLMKPMVFAVRLIAGNEPWTTSETTLKDVKSGMDLRENSTSKVKMRGSHTESGAGDTPTERGWRIGNTRVRSPVRPPFSELAPGDCWDGSLLHAMVACFLDPDCLKRWSPRTGLPGRRARMLYRYLPKCVGLRRITLHKSVSSGDKMYLLLCECSNFLNNLSAAATLLPAMRARLCGYTGLYRTCQSF
ncbi:hypothetical protein PR048_014686 [Dryococelus australis]|uniref:DUF7153 domain-containing protein n=1 Tax=Dryococelus australis TaxID=614101 RepID=A0ABQ9HEW8_9NEOP|nr:hypothetical protein PR048_014686 [Dryococelus australis]